MKKRQSLPDLVLNLKAEYFDQIVAGTKRLEYRLQTPYWNKRLLVDPTQPQWSPYRQFNSIILRKGYPKAGTPGHEIVLPWIYAVRQNITHPHFGKHPVAVHAIGVLQP